MDTIRVRVRGMTSSGRSSPTDTSSKSRVAGGGGAGHSMAALIPAPPCRPAARPTSWRPSRASCALGDPSSSSICLPHRKYRWIG